MNADFQPVEIQNRTKISCSVTTKLYHDTNYTADVWNQITSLGRY